MSSPAAPHAAVGPVRRPVLRRTLLRRLRLPRAPPHQQSLHRQLALQRLPLQRTRLPRQQLVPPCAEPATPPPANAPAAAPPLADPRRPLQAAWLASRGSTGRVVVAPSAAAPLAPRLVPRSLLQQLSLQQPLPARRRRRPARAAESRLAAPCTGRRSTTSPGHPAVAPSTAPSTRRGSRAVHAPRPPCAPPSAASTLALPAWPGRASRGALPCCASHTAALLAGGRSSSGRPSGKRSPGGRPCSGFATRAAPVRSLRSHALARGGPALLVGGPALSTRGGPALVPP